MCLIFVIQLSIKTFWVFLFNWPVQVPTISIAALSQISIGARRKNSSLLYFYVSSKSLINKLFNHGIFLPARPSCDSCVPRCRHRHRRLRCRRRWLRFSRPSLATHPTLTFDTNTTISRKIPRDVPRVHAQRTVFSVAQRCRTHFYSTKKVIPRWPTSDDGH